MLNLLTSMNLQEQISRIQSMMGIYEGEDNVVPNHIRRRYSNIVNILQVVLEGSYICDYESADEFIRGVFFNMSEYLYEENIDGMDKYEIMEFVVDHLKDMVNKYYDEHIEFCSEN